MRLQSIWKNHQHKFQVLLSFTIWQYIHLFEKKDIIISTWSSFMSEHSCWSFVWSNHFFGTSWLRVPSIASAFAEVWGRWLGVRIILPLGYRKLSLMIIKWVRFHILQISLITKSIVAVFPKNVTPLFVSLVPNFFLLPSEHPGHYRKA